jgi:hypothetical protein
VSSAALHAQPWSVAEDTPLDFSQVYSLAAGFITSCPPTNPALPVVAFPALAGSPANAPSGTSVTYTFKSTGNSSTPLYAAYYSGLSVVLVPLSGAKKATVPAGIIGTYYTIIVSCPSPFFSGAVELICLFPLDAVDLDGQFYVDLGRKHRCRPTHLCRQF